MKNASIRIISALYGIVGFILWWQYGHLSDTASAFSDPVRFIGGLAGSGLLGAALLISFFSGFTGFILVRLFQPMMQPQSGMVLQVFGIVLVIASNAIIWASPTFFLKNK